MGGDDSPISVCGERYFFCPCHPSDGAKVCISAYDSCIKVKNAPTGSVLEIYSVVGIKVKEIKLTSSDGEYPVNIPKGYYIIRIGETVRKVVIR